MRVNGGRLAIGKMVTFEDLISEMSEDFRIPGGLVFGWILTLYGVLETETGIDPESREDFQAEAWKVARPYEETALGWTQESKLCSESFDRFCGLSFLCKDKYISKRGLDR